MMLIGKLWLLTGTKTGCLMRCSLLMPIDSLLIDSLLIGSLRKPMGSLTGRLCLLMGTKTGCLVTCRLLVGSLMGRLWQPMSHVVGSLIGSLLLLYDRLSQAS